MKDKLVLHIVSHTHWDREWYMSFQPFRRRLVKLFDHLINIFDEIQQYKYFTFDGQIIAINDYLEIRPEQEQKIKKLVEEGKLFIGPWYTQPNGFMVSGESLIRNLIFGQREGEKLGGCMKVCYLPDSFGQISQLPQIINGFGIEDVVSWRGVPKDSKTAFIWNGADDTECLFFYLLGSYGNASALPIK